MKSENFEKVSSKVPLSYVTEVEDLENFDHYGVYLIRNFVKKEEIDILRKEINKVINGDYSTGIIPDKFKVAKSVVENEGSYSICNGWKSNSYIKEFCTQCGFGEVAKKIMDWGSVKLNQDSIFRVPPKSTATSMHQDNAYQKWHNSNNGILTAWCALVDITSESGGINYLLGSHNNCEALEMIAGPFITGDDPYKPLVEKFGPNWKDHYELYQPILKPGDVIFHHGNIWHGSTENVSPHNRESISVHLMDGNAQFSGIDINPLFNKFRKYNTEEMDPGFFPYCR